MRSRAERREGALCRRRQSIPRNVLSRVCAPGGGMPLGYPVSTPGVPSVYCRSSYPNAYPVVPCARLVAGNADAPQRAVAGLRRLPRPAKPNRDGKVHSPANGPTGTVWAPARPGKSPVRRWARKVRIANPRKASGPDSSRAGWACSGRLRRVCRRVVCAWRRAQCSPPRVAAFGTAVRMARHGNDTASTNPWLVCTRRRL